MEMRQVLAVVTSALMLALVTFVAFSPDEQNSGTSVDLTPEEQTSTSTDLSYRPVGTCGGTISVYNPTTRTTQTVAQGQGFGVNGNFAPSAPAVTFQAEATHVMPQLSCRTSYEVTTSQEDVSDSLNVGASVTGSPGSAGDQYSFTGSRSEYSSYAMLKMMCTTPMEASTGASLSSQAAKTCADDYIGFRSQYGQCFVSGMQSASQLMIVISTEASSSSQQIKNTLKLGKVKVSDTNITSSLTDALKESSATVRTFTFGLSNQQFDFVAVSEINQMASAISAFSGATDPAVVAVATTPYSSLNRRCKLNNAGCIAQVRSDYERYTSKLDLLVSSYTKASSEPNDYTMTSWQIYIKPSPWYSSRIDYQKAQITECDGGPAADSNSYNNGCRDPQSHWRISLDLWLAEQSKADSWWLDWNNDVDKQDSTCADGATWTSLRSKLLLTDDSELNKAIAIMPKEGCPEDAKRDKVSIRGLSKLNKKGSPHNGWYVAPPLCCAGGMSPKTRSSRVHCKFTSFKSGKDCYC